jgi:nucleotidyltransferase AbiEii toxin of type IV toxin-antitoxin system/WYL domain-containing protein
MQKFDIYKNPRGALSCQGTLAYRGPVSPRGKNIPRIKLDLTADELLVLKPVRLPVFHPYSDEPEDGIKALSYAYEEAFGEKIRALAERTRPRDLYDVINLFRNTEARPAGSVVRDVLKKKCEFKGIAIPVIDDLTPHKPDLEGAWPHMLGHQLPSLPPVESFWEALPAFFAWLREEIVPAAPAAFALGSGEKIIRVRSLQLPIPSAVQSSLEAIRFAAANRLCVDLDYQGSKRRIEPYSLRETRDGNIILHAWNRDSNAHRSYRVDRIEGAHVTGETFTPRYEVELVPSGPQTIPPTSRTGSIGRSTARPAGFRSTRSRRQSTSSFGPTYIYECGLCGKKFRRKTQTSTLNPHKTPDGYQCSGRTALYVDTQY